MQGIFISFEGPDGAGKTTQLKLLAGYLRRRGYTVTCTREPGGTSISDIIRQILLDPGHKEMYARTEALLYMAARAQHVAELIRPALRRGEFVLSDRYADSTIVYQGVARGLAKNDLAVINQFAAEGLAPDLTILLDGDTDILRSRLNSRGGQDRIEREAAGFHEQVRLGFKELAAAEPGRIRTVSAQSSEKEVHQTIVAIIEEFLNVKGIKDKR